MNSEAKLLSASPTAVPVSPMLPKMEEEDEELSPAVEAAVRRPEEEEEEEEGVPEPLK